MSFPISFFKSKATNDVRAYGQLLLSKGGTDIFANGEASNLRAFAEQLYAIAGHTDFWALRSAQNMGSGSVCYSFHGRASTLVNGPTWSADGIVLVAASSQYIDTGWLRNATSLFLFLAAQIMNSNCLPVTQDQVNVGANRIMSLSKGGGSAVFDAEGGYQYIGTDLDTVDDPATRTLIYNPSDGGIKLIDTTAVFGTPPYTSLRVPTSRTVLLGLRFNRATPANATDGTFSLFLGADILSDGQAKSNAIRAAYKDTIGTGLGLP